MEVRIFKPAKTAMQSGRAKSNSWVMEFEPRDAVRPDPLMGWSGSADTSKQVRLSFDSREDAVAYAEKHGHSYTIHEERSRKIKPKAYADNFAYHRIAPWTH
ncbi:ETC complex I subunit [Aestuariispira insulae]|uniref:ETC complex I subunit-like protein n=1 Tax=Aestuariispira insulae TaxID=1461337 RepID=A0A3D9HNA3_9PROT|nr:ETC complex I subunit [Aestuariispira insulae]RED50987.1 ETC complex I subunit-like protein [Aestuariispira insulae]